MKEYIAVKFIDEEQGSIEGLGVPYYGPAAGKDLTGEYFDKDTDFCPDWFKVRPLLYHHGLDPVIKTAPIGKVTEWALKDAGLWVKGQLDLSNKYWNIIRTLIKAGKLYFSSGGVSHLVEKDPDGHIKRWPWIEQSLTPTPANPFAQVAYKSIILQAGPNNSAIKALAPEIAELATQAGIDLSIVKEDEVMAGLQDEQEHNDVTGGDPAQIMKIVAAHLKEDPEYYSKTQAALKKDKSENIDKEQSEMEESMKMEKPAGAPAIKPDPSVSAEANGHKPGEQKAPPPECPVKTMKCSKCGKDITLPPDVLSALQALIDSAQSAFNMGGGQAQTSATPGAPPQPGPENAPSNPKLSQGMAPENHGEEPAKATAGANPVPAVPQEGPGSEPPPGEEESSPHEIAEGPDHEAIESHEKEKEEHSAVKALMTEFDNRMKAAVEEATKSLKERIAYLESEPATGGPIRRAVKTTDNPKMDAETTKEIDREAAIKSVMDYTDNEQLKQQLGWELALRQTKTVVSQGPQAPKR